jgi:hypothetical protein
MHTIPYRVLLYNCHYVIVNMFQEFIEMLEYIMPFVYHLDPIVVELCY